VSFSHVIEDSIPKGDLLVGREYENNHQRVRQDQVLGETHPWGTSLREQQVAQTQPATQDFLMHRVNSQTTGANPKQRGHG
jgi:hypothetical protein